VTSLAQSLLLKGWERQIRRPRVAIELRDPVGPFSCEHARLALFADALRFRNTMAFRYVCPEPVLAKVDKVCSFGVKTQDAGFLRSYLRQARLQQINWIPRGVVGLPAIAYPGELRSHLFFNKDSSKTLMTKPAQR
jgi:hypothetical protein